MTIHLHKGDLPDGLSFGTSVAVDSETMGLKFRRDELCVVQLSAGDGNAHVVQLDRASYDAPNLKRLLQDERVLKIFHFARFDVAMFRLHLGVTTTPIYCTKIASKLVRTYLSARPHWAGPHRGRTLRCALPGAAGLGQADRDGGAGARDPRRSPLPGCRVGQSQRVLPRRPSALRQSALRQSQPHGGPGSELFDPGG